MTNVIFKYILNNYYRLLLPQFTLNWLKKKLDQMSCITLTGLIPEEWQDLPIKWLKLLQLTNKLNQLKLLMVDFINILQLTDTLVILSQPPLMNPIILDNIMVGTLINSLKQKEDLLGNMTIMEMDLLRDSKMLDSIENLNNIKMSNLIIHLLPLMLETINGLVHL